MNYTYSPLPINDYFLHGLNGNCEGGAISRLPKGNAIWNLFWLSFPKLDMLPGAGPKWAMHYQPTRDAGMSITADVILDEVLYRKLLMHPTAFASWFEREDHSIYDVYGILGGPAWVETVLKRARESAHRMAMEVPAIKREGNVTHAIFGRKVA